MKVAILISFASLAAVMLCCISTSQAEAPTDSVWLKAVALSELNDNLVPGSIRTYMQETDKYGRPKDDQKYYETWAKLMLGEDGQVQSEIVKAIENGEDVTEKRKAEEEEAKKKNEDEEGEESESHEMEGYSPFDSERQERLSISRMPAEETLDGKNAIVYQFSELTEDDETIGGRAWLEAGTGIPLKVEYTVVPLPKRVKEMVTTMEYEYIPPDFLIVKHMTIQATGGILFIKKHFRMEMTFTDYWRLPQKKEESQIH
jgi:hypothetical protein